MGELKDELIQQQLIVPFNSEGIELFNVKNWTIYQYIQKPVPSKYTLPEDYCSPTVALQPNRIERNKKEKNIIKKSVEYEKQFPDKNVNKSLGKYLDYTNNPSHKGAIEWLTNEKEKKKPQFRKTPTGLLIAYCSKCGNQEFPNDEWQLKRGSECHKVEYVLEKPGENVGVTNP